MRQGSHAQAYSNTPSEIPLPFVLNLLSLFSISAFVIRLCLNLDPPSFFAFNIRFRKLIVDMTCESKHWGQEQVQWVVQKITRGFAKHRYEETTNVVSLSNGPDFWVQQDCCSCPWWVTLSSAISSLENKMLCRAKVRESGFLLPTTLSSHVFRSLLAIQILLASRVWLAGSPNHAPESELNKMRNKKD